VNFSDIDPTAFRLSLQVATTATLLCLVVGLPVTWWIWRSRPAWSRILSTLVLLPLVLPPTSIGYYLLFALGRQSALGRFLIDDLGIRVVFTWPGAAIAAAVVSLPLFVRTAQGGFEQVEPDIVDVARTLGRRPTVILARVVIPLAWPSLLAATLLSFARAFGEFGATVIVAGNIPGETQTVPVAIYDAVQAGNDELANAIAFITLIFGFVVLGVTAVVLQRVR
jgi:molybdate transport system permease protein